MQRRWWTLHYIPVHPTLLPTRKQRRVELHADSKNRYGPTSLPPLPHVLLRHLQPHRHSRHAHTQPQGISPSPPLPFIPGPTHPTSTRRLTSPPSIDQRHTSMANHKPIPQRRHQQRQRQQIHPPLHLHPCKILPSRRQCLLHRRSRSQRRRPPPPQHLPHHENNTNPPRALCSGSISRGVERCLDARRGDQAGHRRLPYIERGSQTAERENRRGGAKSKQEQKSSYTGGWRNGCEQGAQFHANHGTAAFDFGSSTENTMAEAEAKDGATYKFRCVSRPLQIQCWLLSTFCAMGSYLEANR